MSNIYRFTTGFLYPGGASGPLNNPNTSEVSLINQDSGLSKWKVWSGSPQAGNGIATLDSTTLATLFFRDPRGLQLSIDISNISPTQGSPRLALFVKDTNNYFVAYQSFQTVQVLGYVCTEYQTNTFTGYFSSVTTRYYRQTRFTLSSGRYFASTFFFSSRTFSYTSSRFTSTSCKTYSSVYSTSQSRSAVVDRIINGNTVNIFDETISEAAKFIKVLMSTTLNSVTSPPQTSPPQDSRSLIPNTNFPGHFKVWWESATGTVLHEQHVVDSNINANFGGAPQHTHGVKGGSSLTAIEARNTNFLN